MCVCVCGGAVPHSWAACGGISTGSCSGPTWWCSDELADAVPLHVFTHVQPDDGVLHTRQWLDTGRPQTRHKPQHSLKHTLTSLFAHHKRPPAHAHHANHQDVTPAPACSCCCAAVKRHTHHLNPHLCAKVLLCQDLCELGLAHTRGANQQQRSAGAVGVLQTHTRPAGRAHIQHNTHQTTSAPQASLATPWVRHRLRSDSVLWATKP